ncbi:hypothetical protein [Corynebacterium bovis]|uniref:hypothetical protein n=1 Tax=Corynebacterium bovis TaxID=36808 RepID=UPI0021AB888F|nr:hypothetical protein [Corynebacterium bovis]
MPTPARRAISSTGVSATPPSRNAEIAPTMMRSRVLKSHAASSSSARVAGSVPIPWSVDTRRNRSRIGDGVPTAGHPILIAGCNDPTV